MTPLLRDSLRAHTRSFYIDGGWRAPHGQGAIDVVHAGTEECLASVPAGDARDADAAVRAARAAFEGWSTLPSSERAGFLRAIHAGLEARAEELARLLAAEVGMPLELSRAVQLGLPLESTRYYAALTAEYCGDVDADGTLVVREPIGVVASITPWNYPLHQIMAKIAPALGAGCTVVVKPSEVAPLNAFVLAEIIEACGLPAGVFNLVTGEGAVVGEALAAHPEVDMVSFTGSTRAGRRVTQVAAETLKRVTCELGGKSANVILDDAELEAAVTAGVTNCYLNSGQTCSAWTRMLVPESRRDEVVALAKRVAESFTLGDPFAPGSRLGPLVSGLQRERVRELIRAGVNEGATLVTGGAEPPEHLPQGFFVRPTVFADVRAEMRIAREEIFGPVLSILTYRDEDEAVRLANDSIYGLSGAVWSADPERALRVARRLRTGQVAINGAAYNPHAPFGGYKQSGNGRELGRFGFEEFLEVKALRR
ncbi:MAG: aldehyde dehydrogenase family protein [Sandaracinaceae bacterium]|nr:aldehyde dehydrogenase family protein [Sandaracinaceae bacterium]